MSVLTPLLRRTFLRMIKPTLVSHYPLRILRRCIPLVKESLWASKRLLEASNDSSFAFPRYCDETGCKANSASGGLNKWLHQYVPENCVIHSFRHSLRDRLRAVECPSDIVDAIGGWKTSGVGQGYGNGYPLEVLERWMEKITL